MGVDSWNFLHHQLKFFELMPILREKGLADNFEVYIDGGVRRATDILKAVCLGAKGIGIGLSILYAMSGYGDAGVTVIQLLKDEMIMNMRLLGVNKLEELNESFAGILNICKQDMSDDVV